MNSIAEVTFAWEGAGKWRRADRGTDKFVIKVEKAFPRVPFHIIVGSEIIQVSKTEPFGTDLRVTECKRGAVKTTKAAHAKDASVVVRKMVSQTHWVAKAKKEDTLPRASPMSSAHNSRASTSPWNWKTWNSQAVLNV